MATYGKTLCDCRSSNILGTIEKYYLRGRILLTGWLDNFEMEFPVRLTSV